MTGNSESVVRMANDIARNLAVHGEEEAAAETAKHIELFWDPRMKSRAFALLGEPDSGFSSIARSALSGLAMESDHNAT